MSMDDIDKQLYEELEKDARVTISVLSAKVGLSMPAVSERIKKMRNDGFIHAFTVVPGDKLMENCPIKVEMLIKLKSLEDHEKFESYLAQHEHISWYSATVGRFDYVVHIRVKNTNQLGDVIRDMTHQAVVADLESLMMMEEKFSGLSKILIS